MLEIITAKLTMQILLALLLIIVLWTMVQLQRNPNDEFDIKDLIQHNGKLDEKKFTRFGAWVVSTWGFVYLIVNDKLSEWYFIGYMGAWVANVILDKFANGTKNDQNSLPPINTRPTMRYPTSRSDYPEDPPYRNTRND